MAAFAVLAALVGLYAAAAGEWGVALPFFGYAAAMGAALKYKPFLARVLFGLGVTALVVACAGFVTLLAALDDQPWG